MKHALIVAHPDETSFAMTMARAYETTATGFHHAVVLRDLYRIGFQPCLAASERPGPRGFAPLGDVIDERAAIADADVYAFVYPLWFNAPPAMLKGYLDRVFGMGFAYGPGPDGNTPLLRGKAMVSITSSGSPESWLKETGMLEAARKLFDQHFAAVCGLAAVKHLHFGGIEPNITPESVEGCANQVAAMVTEQFGPPSAL